MIMTHYARHTAGTAIRPSSLEISNEKFATESFFSCEKATVLGNYYIGRLVVRPQHVAEINILNDFPLSQDCRTLPCFRVSREKHHDDIFCLNKIDQTKSNLSSRFPFTIGSDSFGDCARN